MSATNTSGVGTESNPIDNSNAPLNAQPSVVDSIVGNVKESLGSLTGNRVTQEEGTIQKTEGSDAKGGLSAGIAEEAKAAANKNI